VAKTGAWHQLLKFSTVGAVAFVVDAVVFNVILLAIGLPLVAKTVSVLFASSLAFVANRHWSFAGRERRGLGREAVLFVIINGAGLAVALAVLWASHYLLHFTSRLADNIAANVVGLGLAAALRFWAYRTLLWRAQPAAVPVETGDGLTEADRAL
jgi:putative flippase GtrA